MTFEQVTFSDLRKIISDSPPWNDLLAEGTLDSAGSGTAVDADEFTYTSDDALNGAWIYLNGGVGAGQERYISDFTASSDTASVVPNWTTTPGATSTYEVHRKARVAQYNRAIKRGLRSDRNFHQVRAMDSSLLGVERQREYALPGNFAHLHSIQYIRESDYDVSAVTMDPWDWEALPNGMIRFKYPIPINAQIRFHGMKFPDIPDEDDDILQVNVELITLYALSVLDTTNHTERYMEYIRFRDDLNLTMPENSVPVSVY